MGVPAIVAAGDRRAAKAVHGESKPYLVLAGRPLVARVVAALQRVPEVSEVWVVGNAERFDYGETEIRYHEASFRDEAEALRDALGAGRVVEDVRPTDAFDVTIVLGQDL